MYLVFCLVWLQPASVFAVKQLEFEWDPNPESNLAGYRLFSRLEGQYYDYSDPVYEGSENSCTILIDDETATYYFMVRAYDLSANESKNSYEVKYEPDEPDPDNVLVLDAINGNGQAYIYLDECIGILSIDEFIPVIPESIPEVNLQSADYPLGLFHMEMVVDIIGGAAMVPIFFSEQAPDDAMWYAHFSLSGWMDHYYHSAFSDNGMSVVLRFEDGGYGDADGLANGVIVHTSGMRIDFNDSYRYVGAEPSEKKYSAGGGCFIDSTNYK